MKNEQKYKAAVEKAKLLRIGKFNGQMEIAKLALSVCEITWGGARKVRDELFTLKRFAKDIEVNEKTLSNWAGIYRGVYEKLSAENKRKASFSVMQNAARFITRDATKKKVNEVAERLMESTPDRKILGYLRETSYILKIVEGGGAFQCRDETLEEVLFYCGLIIDEIKKDKPKLKPKNNALCTHFRRGVFTGAAKFSAPERHWRLTPKDKKVVNYMLREDFCSPTKIGMRVGGHNKSSASAYALRTLYKLTQANLAEINDRGHYRLTRKGHSLLGEKGEAA